MGRVKGIDDVISGNLCSGCGACSAVFPDTYEMVDDIQVGRRPKIIGSDIRSHQNSLDICPGGQLHDSDGRNGTDGLWGEVIKVYEAYASDSSIRNKGSSGGVLTALSLFAVEEGIVDGVVNIQSDPKSPIKNLSTLSENKDSIIASAGSRYIASSPCEELRAEPSKKKNVLFVGKPCDSYAASRLKLNNYDHLHTIVLNLSFFCAGTPSYTGNAELIKKEGLSPENISSLKFRGNGWPGLWTAISDSGESKTLTYHDSWGYLQKYRQWRCYICPDHTGEYSDISVGDPWYKGVDSDNEGMSLVVIRTKAGADFFDEAVRKGRITISKQDNQLLPLSQPNLGKAKGQVWGRLVAMRLLGMEIPIYSGFNLFSIWSSELSFRDKLGSIFGTVKRLIKKKLYCSYSVDK
ncbi:Coenzyme F420 hydrogenase/dehydrogenase, beta subunit C-terminal domain [Amphritea sp.]|uniref:Coenzyme F420 hydrogenase/dehydrogenase, beta subunit C-terminal domain n=1 Tax=Amphritea sp. TaxID=1872502 RepID=UPI0025BA8A6D|nr:Coenzyme F420 hydrogenase/dehydrogenase, beta subunit C-terminal domain [Amphritea sp.]